jgi:orotidine 5'-phosphate decarboxylase subfamily 1
LAGEGTILGLKEQVKELGLQGYRGLILLGEISTEGNVATGKYTDACFRMAARYRDFVVGFVSGDVLDYPERPTGWDFVTFTPGVSLDSKGDRFGQEYEAPTPAIVEGGSDIIVVGRGIYEARNPVSKAQIYQAEGWKAYERRCGMF